MSYSEDFAAVDTAGAPLDPTIMIGADPMVWGAILLALVVAALVGWLIGQGARSRRNDAAHAIWQAVDDAAKAAMKADTEALPARASELRRVLRARLGRTLAFGGELGKRAAALDKALDGEGEDKTRHPAAPAPDSGAGHGHDGHGAGKDDHAAAPSNAASVTIVSVHAPPGAAQSHPADHGKRPMTTKERNDALRLAVADFNDHWRHRSAREDDMRAIVAELCHPGPPRPRLSHGGDHL
ncbi:hypothetical protein GCM10009116_04280 [Brevundimonas basaltis]|uniref:Uncharacterized protein n=1 Tax=Brevundimonas basaltis TaxID=472166 RepID=A0A7W8I1B4_9CAUL|nr:hypothetical protein [Brevundimonas basaltis]MBB5292697.1 hypothetical protein [Brevundimonas basaltis]